MTGAFSLFRGQPEHYSARRLLWDSTEGTFSFFPITPSNCPVLLTSKHLLLSEIILLIDVWLIHFLTLLEGHELSCLAHCFIYNIWHVVSSHPTIVAWMKLKTYPKANILGSPCLSLASFPQCFSATQFVLLHPWSVIMILPTLQIILLLRDDVAALII